MQEHMKADRNVISSLQMLSTEAEVTDTPLANLASFVCAAYSPKGIYIYTISELRWYLFCKHIAKSDKLPFTLGALRQHVLRVHIQTAQARVCGPVSWQPYCEMQDSDHIGLGVNGNIVFMIACAIGFPKMYSFHTLCYLKAEILTKTEFKAAIL